MKKELTPIFYARVVKGKLELEDRSAFANFISKYEGKDLAIILKRSSLIRTGAENRYYWGVIVRMISDEMAILPDEAHDFLKSMFLKEGVEANGKRWEIVKSTASLSIQEFEDYCENCRQWSANELNAPIPMPNEIIEEDL